MTLGWGWEGGGETGVLWWNWPLNPLRARETEGRFISEKGVRYDRDVKKSVQKNPLEVTFEIQKHLGSVRVA